MNWATRRLRENRLERLAYLVGDLELPLTIAAQRLGVSQQLASKDMKELEFRVFGFNERVRRGRHDRRGC